MTRVGAGGQNLGHFKSAILFFSDKCRYFTNCFLESILGQLVPCIVGFDSLASDHGIIPQDGARGQNLGHL